MNVLKILDNNAKNILFYALAIFLLTSNLFGADEFSEAANAIEGASEGGKSILGVIISWGFSLVLPVISVVIGVALGYKFQSKKSEQDQSTGKLYLVLAGCAIAGFFVYVIVAMLFSRILFGDMNEMFTRIYEFWRTVQW
ncbi:hypothetical protein FPD46_01345 [Campylobacter peloridis]|uniref:Uncharacterized protein n=1 Tax=Campylobacter peloridis TaxID=488546 RepID=A0A5C7DZ40_9BACT|nr:hypothetical protein [Campylobacter peloridis]TXE84186.1 hypothetical protein FPD46_01345 [Campylobacter peloridis]